VREHPIVVTESGAHRLGRFLATEVATSVRDRQRPRELEWELKRALVLQAVDVPADIITLHSWVEVLDRDSGKLSEYRLVLPTEANLTANQMSVLAPLGAALLGYREGDEVMWRMPGGPRRLLIQSVRQPAEMGAPAARTPSAPRLRGAAVLAGAH
jgi:regulator of nucleoside diphosphate kinase